MALANFDDSIVTLILQFACIDESSLLSIGLVNKKFNALLFRDKIFIEELQTRMLPACYLADSRQYYVFIDKKEWKFETLVDLLVLSPVTTSLIFCNSYLSAMKLKNNLLTRDYAVGVVCASMEVTEQERTIRSFRIGNFHHLICSQIDPCDIHVAQLGVIINYDIPRRYRNYIRNIGRRSRYQRVTAISFVLPDKLSLLEKYGKLFGAKIEELPMNLAEI
jgi:translation initiation factor 4A